MKNIVHCNECKYARMTIDGKCKYCEKWDEKYYEVNPFSNKLYLNGDFFCAFGENKPIKLKAVNETETIKKKLSSFEKKVIL